ncbi:CdaR family transcriptional regulator [Cytobacillus firmus]|uniref:Helix-turn-helix domain-containing protein n=1 Tax=Cytobacillus firmus TaxID=1399 RepID=A0AA46SGS6_CYTFI|nr:sugar diacid recognition domain-containing protein [Cytobacillus firmus]UYG98108.1 helix-turn-helix domain-containing protein [Cytobacillus firmus]
MLDKLAQEIAKTTSEVIGHDVLITDQHGIVLGSSDLSRIGTLHQASVGTIFRRKEMTHNDLVSKTMTGVKPGMTIPIELSGEIVGTLGITGEPGKVEKFGMLAKKYAEILLREEIINKSSLLRERALQSLVQEIAAFDSMHSDEMLLLTRGRELGYDLKPPHIVIVIDLFQFNHVTSEIHLQSAKKDSSEIHIQSLKMNIESRIKKIFSNQQDITVSLGSDKYVVFYILEYKIHEEEIYEAIKNKCNRLLSELKELEIHASIGIGTIGSNLKGLNESYHAAWRAIRIGKKMAKHLDIFFIRDFVLEELFSFIHKNNAQRFVAEVVTELKEYPDSDELFRTILAWCESSLSPINSSKELNIHRNTLFYRLNKIEQITGMNLRNFREALTLYLATKIMLILESESKEN